MDCRLFRSRMLARNIRAKTQEMLKHFLRPKMTVCNIDVLLSDRAIYDFGGIQPY